MKLVLDINTGHALLRKGAVSWVVRKKWLDFYVLLASGCSHEQSKAKFVTNHDLHGVGAWAHGKAASIGKEVARHLDNLQRKGLGGMVEHASRTIAWRLALTLDQIEFSPSRTEVLDWLNLQRWTGFLPPTELSTEAVFPWLEKSARAILHVQRGAVQEGLDLVKDARNHAGGVLLLEAVSDLLELRFSWRLGIECDQDEALMRCRGGIGNALRSRASVVHALTFDRSNMESASQELVRIASRLESGPDLSGLAMISNALGLLYRRRTLWIRADQYLRYAAFLSVATFDLLTLEHAIFNLAHTHYQQAESVQDLRRALLLIMLDRDICNTVRIGHDSAQAEIIGGTICLHLSELDLASGWLERGQAIVSRTGKEYDRACLERLAARIEWAKAYYSNGLTSEVRTRVEKQLKLALDRFMKLGSSDKFVRMDLKDLAAGRPPKRRVPETEAY
jgi:hypothetical protein